MKKKIFLLSGSLVGGGTEAMTVNIANSFVDNGWDVQLILLNLNHEVYLKRLSLKVNLFVLNVKHSRYSFFKLLSFIYKMNPTIFLVFNYELTIILIIIKKVFRFNFKIITRNNSTFSKISNNLNHQDNWRMFIFRTILKITYPKSDYVINQCLSMQKDLLKKYPFLKNRCSIIYNPITKYIQDYEKIYNFPTPLKKDYLLCVGRLEKEKAFNYAIKAFAGISKKFPKLRLKIVGKGSLESNLKQLAADYKVKDRVDFEGFKDNLIPFYIHAKATILTSEFEGFPNVLIESIFLNTPVVAFDCKSGPSEIIYDGINGYLVKHKNLEDLKKKISLLLSKRLYEKDIRNTVERNRTEKVIKMYEKIVNLLL